MFKNQVFQFKNSSERKLSWGNFVFHFKKKSVLFTAIQDASFDISKSIFATFFVVIRAKNEIYILLTLLKKQFVYIFLIR